MKEFGILYKKMKRYFLKSVYIFQKFQTKFLNNFVFAYYFCVIGERMIAILHSCPLQRIHALYRKIKFKK